MPYDDNGQWVNGDTGAMATRTAAPRPPPPPPPPPPDAGQLADARSRGMNMVYDPKTNTYLTVPMSASERLDTQLTDAGKNGPGVTPPSTTAPTIPGASTTPATPNPVQPRAAITAPPVARPGAAPAVAGAPPPVAGGYQTPVNREGLEQRVAGQPGQPGTGGPGFTPTSVDYSRYDQAAQGYDRAVSTFQSELDRLSGVDPFGNQAFLRQATDRATAQAGGLAAGGLSTATARAGNMRQAQGVQAQMSAQGRDQMAIQRAQDEQTAGGLRIQAAGGMAQTLGQSAGNEVELAKLQTQTMATNMQQYLDKYKFDKALTQQDVENLRGMAVAYSQIDMQRYQTDVQYQAQVDQNMVQKYAADQQLQGMLKQIASSEKFTLKELVMGGLGAAAGLGGAIIKSDRRSKFDVRDPDLRDLEDYLGRTKGKLYQYKEPNKPGQRAGLNYGPMAQDLQKSKIGRTVVVEGEDGLSVDTGRLALADHAALAALAAEVKAFRDGNDSPAAAGGNNKSTSTETSTKTSTETSTETSTVAHTTGNFTATVTGGAGRGATTNVTIVLPTDKAKRK